MIGSNTTKDWADSPFDLLEWRLVEGTWNMLQRKDKVKIGDKVPI